MIIVYLCIAVDNIHQSFIYRNRLKRVDEPFPFALKYVHNSIIYMEIKPTINLANWTGMQQRAKYIK